jgi:hypothetical protein
MNKPIKEWGVVKFLTDKLPDAAGDIAQTALGIATGENPVRAIGDLLSGKDELSKEDIQQAQQLFADDLEREKMMMADRADARAMNTEIATSEYSSWLARNFIYLMSSFLLLAATFFGIALIYVEIPPDNRRLVEMFADVFLFAGGVAVIQYFIGRPNLKGFKRFRSTK